VNVPHYDVMVLGAGAAGLAAAAELARAGRSVVILEARERIGGRIWTRRAPGLAAPLEMGAEFIHGHAPVTRALLAQAGSTAIETADAHCTLEDGEPQARPSLFPRVLEAMQQAPVLEQRDVSFDELLDQHLLHVLNEDERRSARMMAQGFDAADTSEASARAILAEWSGDTLGDVPQSRPRDGYEAMLATLLAAFDPARVRLMLNAPVFSVEWSAGAVQASGEFLGRPYAVRATCAVITLPLGVLQAAPGAPGAVRFAPALESKRDALAKLASGPVVKILLRFCEPFWEQLRGGSYREMSFFHAPRADIRTFWTQAPRHVPLLVAWAGGPQALRVSMAATPADLARSAVNSLRAMFGGAVDIAERLQGFYYHDWQQDPYARGAYSYVKVGGGSARAMLARPLGATLFFAGEATDTADEAGTVTGALESGIRAARELLSC
jgi:monoamine oxidase